MGLKRILVGGEGALVYRLLDVITGAIVIGADVEPIEASTIMSDTATDEMAEQLGRDDEHLRYTGALAMLAAARFPHALAFPIDLTANIVQNEAEQARAARVPVLPEGFLLGIVAALVLFLSAAGARYYTATAARQAAAERVATARQRQTALLRHTQERKLGYQQAQFVKTAVDAHAAIRARQAAPETFLAQVLHQMPTLTKLDSLGFRGPEVIIEGWSSEPDAPGTYAQGLRQLDGGQQFKAVDPAVGKRDMDLPDPDGTLQKYEVTTFAIKATYPAGERKPVEIEVAGKPE